MDLREELRISSLHLTVLYHHYFSTSRQPIQLCSDCTQIKNTQLIGWYSLDHSSLGWKICGTQEVPSSGTFLQPSSQSCFYQCLPLRSIKIHSDTLRCSPIRRYFAGFASGCHLSNEVDHFHKNWEDPIFSSVLNKSIGYYTFLWTEYIKTYHIQDLDVYSNPD